MTTMFHFAFISALPLAGGQQLGGDQRRFGLSSIHHPIYLCYWLICSSAGIDRRSIHQAII